MSLDQSILESPIPANVQAQIAERFWGPGTHAANLRPYFQYYTEQCRIVYQSQRSRLPVKAHHDIVELADEVLGGSPRAVIKEKLVRKYKSTDGETKDAFDACIDLTVRLLFMLDTGELLNTFSGRKTLIWSCGTIQDFIHDTFPNQMLLNHVGLKLGRGFDVSNMVRIAGFKIELTTNLSDHLRLRDADKTVTIFHHASFLKSQRKSALFPKGLVEETLSTLSLLFPQGHRGCAKWYNKQEPSDQLDHNVLQCGSAPRRLEEYNYWHDRLVILKEEFDESRPSTLSQWWNDRREGTQWYTLWVAVFLTLLFGLAQSIIGAMQLYKAYHP